MPITLTITLDDNKQVTVHGPIQDRFVCYAMLEVAKDAIRNHVDKAAENASGLVVAPSLPPGMPPPFPRKATHVNGS